MTAFEERLSESVRPYPGLYDLSRQDYKDQQNTQSSWILRGEVVGRSYDDLSFDPTRECGNGINTMPLDVVGQPHLFEAYKGLKSLTRCL